ncbi:carbohydrate kinase [Candidatus Sumerlaeota bacterium]|nr:carbohydrate kinase [Candidatus Sumerlaeota bacterium]
MAEIICLGELLIDMVSSKVDVSLEESPGFIRAPGGAPANVAVGISRLGRKSGFIGCVGNDHFGRFLKRLLEDEGVETSNLHLIDKARTTLVFVGVHSDQKKEMVFYRHPGADMFLAPEQIKEDYLKQAKIFHFGSISLIDELPGSATLKALTIARQGGLMVSYDPNYRPDLWRSPEEARERIWSVMEQVDVVKISEEEWELVTGVKNFSDGAKSILRQGVKLVVVSCGEKGAYFTTQKHSDFVSGFKVKVAETTGAGDAFVAALLVRLLRAFEGGKDISDLSFDELRGIIRWANAAGALACTKTGAIPALPSLSDVEKFIKSG